MGSGASKPTPEQLEGVHIVVSELSLVHLISYWALIGLFRWWGADTRASSWPGTSPEPASHSHSSSPRSSCITVSGRSGGSLGQALSLVKLSLPSLWLASKVTEADEVLMSSEPLLTLTGWPGQQFHSKRLSVITMSRWSLSLSLYLWSLWSLCPGKSDNTGHWEQEGCAWVWAGDLLQVRNSWPGFLARRK